MRKGKMKITIKDSGLISKPNDGKFNFNAWPSIINVRKGLMLAAWSGERNAHICPFGKVTVARSYDGGHSWEPPYTAMETPLDDRDAGLCAYKGKIYLTSFNNSRKTQRRYMKEEKRDEKTRAFYEGYLDIIDDEEEKRYLGSLISVSTDEGKTFSPPETLPITSPHGPCVTKDGKLFFAGRAFSDDEKASFDYLDEGIYALTLDEDAKPLNKPVKIAPAYSGDENNAFFCEPHALTLPDGRIIMGLRAQNPETGLFTIYDCFSLDGGKTFSAPRYTGFDGSPPHYLMHSSGAIVISYARRKPPFSQCARLSFDAGNSWSEEIILRQDAPHGDIGYPATAENDEGDLVTVYYQKSEKTKANQIFFTVWSFEK